MNLLSVKVIFSVLIDTGVSGGAASKGRDLTSFCKSRCTMNKGTGIAGALSA
jgi:hypothetical protein